MSLSYQETKLVRSTIPSLKEHGEHIATVFYKSMLRNHPELNNYFNNVNMQNGSQPRALTSLILAFASGETRHLEVRPNDPWPPQVYSWNGKEWECRHV